MGRPPKFSRSGLQRVALRLVDDRGLEHLSMRSLATAVGTGPMTLYNHVRDRADLELLLVDAVMAELRTGPPKARSPRAEVEQLAMAMWRAVRAHPHVIPLLLTRRSRSPEALEFAEALLASLARGGRKGAALRTAYAAVSAFIAGFAQTELHGPWTSSTVSRAGRLPASRYPLLAQLARGAKTKDPADEFRAGLGALLKGL